MVGRMRIGSWRSCVLAALVVFAGSTLVQACAGDLSDGTDDRTTSGPKKHRNIDGGGGDDKDAGLFGNPTGPAMAAGDGGGIIHPYDGPTIIKSMRIEPENETLEVQAGKVGTLKYKAFATLEGSDDEVDITDRTVFY